MECAIIVTYRCNARCKMCHTWQPRSNNDREISPEIMDKIPCDQHRINLTGGEPALRDDLVIKKMELRNEKMKQDPNKDKIATLSNEIMEIRNKIRGVADKYEVPMQCMKYRGRNMHENLSQSE